MPPTWAYGSFKITFPDGKVMFDNAHSEVVFDLNKSAQEVLQDFIAQEEILIKEHFQREDLIIELGLSGFVNDLNRLPVPPWAER